MNRLTTEKWQALRKECYSRDEYRCRKCLKHTKNPAAHHVIPYEKGGEDSIINLITVCPECHTFLDHEYIRLSGTTRYMRDYILQNKVSFSLQKLMRMGLVEAKK